MALDKNDLLSLVATNKPDNTTGLITPAKSREVDEQIITGSANLEELTSQTFKGPVTFDGGVSGLGGTKTYWFDDNDTATASSPISHTGGAANTYLTNDGLGSFTNAYNPDSNDRLWNSSTNKFDFTSLKQGDIVEVRGDIEIDTASANQEIDISMSLAEGESFPYELNIQHIYYKSISSGNKITFLFRFYMGDEQTRLGGARFRIISDDNATIKVNGWFYSITEV
jgi:hypothetical protein